MYTPKFNQVTDRALLLEAMRAYSFAILFGPAEAGLATAAATHLPLLVKGEGEHGVLEGHFARANPHWKALAGRETLVVFPGPHSYVSPSFYVDPLSVPTWNYVSIHAYGRLEILEDQPTKARLVAELIAVHEPAFADRWQQMPEGYRRTMLAGIMGFRIRIARIEGKFKLSQNRAETERVNVHNAQAAGTSDQRELARWMERLSVTGTPVDDSQATETAAHESSSQESRTR
jgi:transcriptional regulator